MTNSLTAKEISDERLGDHLADVLGPSWGTNWEGAAHSLKFLLLSDGYLITPNAHEVLQHRNAELNAAAELVCGYLGHKGPCEDHLNFAYEHYKGPKDA